MESVKSNFSLPFNSYDFFGYILPGTLFSLGLAFIFYDYVDYNACLASLKNVGTVFAILISLGILAILYFVGQFIGCISHILYDRLMVRNIIGYPFQYILGLKPRPDDSVRITYLILVVCFFVTLLSPELYELLNRFQCFKQHSNWIICVILSSVFFILFFSAFFLRIWLVISRMRRMNNLDEYIRDADENSIEEDSFMQNICAKLARVAWYIFFPLRKLTSTDTKINPVLRKQFLDKMRKKYGVNLETSHSYTSDAYWMTYISILKSDVRHDVKIGNWLNLYGCLRNYSCAFLVLASIAAFKQWCYMAEGTPFVPYSKFVVIALFLSLVLFVRYWIIYFSYYTKYIIRAFVMDGNSFQKGNKHANQ